MEATVNSAAGSVRIRKRWICQAAFIAYYQLTDEDTHGVRTEHGPVGVDWDGDGMPDDWEIEHGLDPTFDDADLDSDGDGASNLLEYQIGTDPLSADSGAAGDTAGSGGGGGCFVSATVRDLAPGMLMLPVGLTLVGCLARLKPRRRESPAGGDRPNPLECLPDPARLENKGKAW